MIAGGLVLLTVVADRLFGIAVTRREWIGVASDGGRACVSRGDARQRRGQRALALRRRHARDLRFGGRGCAGLLLAARSRHATSLAVSAGLLWAASDTSIKALSVASRLARHRGAGPSARVRDPGRVAARAARLRPQPPARRRRAGDRADERGSEPDNDRRRADRVRRAAAGRASSSSPSGCWRSRLVIIAAASDAATAPARDLHSAQTTQ